MVLPEKAVDDGADRPLKGGALGPAQVQHLDDEGGGGHPGGHSEGGRGQGGQILPPPGPAGLAEKEL